LNRFDKKVVDVGFALVGSPRFSDVHWPLHVASFHHNVKVIYSHFSHYSADLTEACSENKALLQDAPGFLQEITSTAVEVRLDPDLRADSGYSNADSARIEQIQA
jgi:hypothetical protein